MIALAVEAGGGGGAGLYLWQFPMCLVSLAIETYPLMTLLLYISWTHSVAPASHRWRRRRTVGVCALAFYVVVLLFQFLLLHIHHQEHIISSNCLLLVLSLSSLRLASVNIFALHIYNKLLVCAWVHRCISQWSYKSSFFLWAYNTIKALILSTIRQLVYSL